MGIFVRVIALKRHVIDCNQQTFQKALDFIETDRTPGFIS